MKKENTTDELWLQKEVIEYLRCTSLSFFTAKRYEVLRAKAIKDGSRRVKIACVMTSRRVDLLVRFSPCIEYPALSPTLSPKREATREAIAIVAMRRGSSIRILPEKCSSKASGTAVDFPAAVSAVKMRKRLCEPFSAVQISSRYGVIGKLSICGVYIIILFPEIRL